MITVLLGSAQTWECDQMGHWNVRFYLERFREAAICWQDAVDGWPVAPRAVGADHVRFLREVLPGTPFAVRAGLVESSEGPARGAVQLYLELCRTVDDVVCATCLSDCFTAPEAPLPAAHTRYRVDLPDWGRPFGVAVRPPAEVDVQRADELGLVPIHQRVVASVDCDEHGVARPGLLMGCVSDGIPHLVWRLRAQDRGSGGSRGGAALEYRFIYRRLPHAGQRITVRSGLAAVGAKTMHFVHWLLDPQSGEAWASAEAVAVSFDLEKRRAVPFGDDERAQLEKQIIHGLRP